MNNKEFKIVIILLMVMTSILFSGYLLRYYQYNQSLEKEKNIEDMLILYDKENAILQDRIKSIDEDMILEDVNIKDLQINILQRTDNVNLLRNQITVYEKLKNYDMTVFITPDNEKIRSFANQIDTENPVTIYKFVRDEIKYVEDYLTFDYRFEYWQFPEETLKLRTGDCEDQAILLCTLLRAKGYSPEDVKVVFGLTSSNTGHAWVELFYEGGWVVFDPTSSANEYIEKTRYYSLINANYKGSFNDVNYEFIQ
ncbi:MAG: Transglutaminase-like superfamily protein [Candidatus Methanofastidiosum methylothiophilum]|uniref:Transglutaminase-like superfamily protein n=1 Tax=Candidatus Methanofastidiosum methylothiophilum TaxID=1705564 RepID=A0A150IS25_9EURY|nr:MAG: Transglutaminase-like superfamily protein [Candidatus Methanofastidiosum methylthiophilus]KYC47645.1 MAG: Transglutaminase-like superfamily protein [Candidatus Methanofastidiosum methylthiophilus]KYC50106.1 MAG: Transglutaminase-like superfamily protein [Candidatus Methanofastidiosum methylthiophilus]